MKVTGRTWYRLATRAFRNLEPEHRARLLYHLMCMYSHDPEFRRLKRRLRMVKRNALGGQPRES